MFLLGNVLGQNPLRYDQKIFPNVTESIEIFSTGVPKPVNAFDFYSFITGYPLNVKEYNTQQVNLYMDIFEPQGDTISKRPLVILCFGGGFLSGNRKYWSIRLIATALARMGYVTASIDYRLGMNIYDKDLGARSVYRGVQDSRSAIRFFKADASALNKYKIDTSNIFIGGHSSGAFISLHNIFLDNDIERPNSTRNWMQDGREIPDLGCLDCVGDNKTFNGKAKGVFSLAGAIGFLNLIENGEETPPEMFHSIDDGTVPYNSGEPFSNISDLVIGSDLPIVHGSLPISLRCDTLSADYQFYKYTNRGHDVHENGDSALHSDIIPSINGWFFENYLKPESTSLSGAIDICTDNLHHEFTLNHNGISYFDWQITGGTINNLDKNSNKVNLLWDENASIHEISVFPYSCIGAPGIYQKLGVNIYSEGNNTWLGGPGSWNNLSKWSNGHLPISCENVTIPSENSEIEILVDASTISKIRSLEIGQNVRLVIEQLAEIDIIGN